MSIRRRLLLNWIDRKIMSTCLRARALLRKLLMYECCVREWECVRIFIYIFVLYLCCCWSFFSVLFLFYKNLHMMCSLLWYCCMLVSYFIIMKIWSIACDLFGRKFCLIFNWRRVSDWCFAIYRFVYFRNKGKRIRRDVFFFYIQLMTVRNNSNIMRLIFLQSIKEHFSKCIRIVVKRE